MTDNQRLALEALSMDLLRVALGRHRGSHKMAYRFIVEAKARLSEIAPSHLTTKISKVLADNSERQAEDLLMYSTITKNRALSL